jgi:FkbM family methyltransferase
LFSKEPETIDWINTFSKDDILFDIGANVGVYSIYAGANDIKVFSFEPESKNYSLLNTNIFLNNLSEKVTALNIALNDSDLLDNLYLPNFEVGSALNNFGENKDWEKKEFKPVYKQGIIAYSLDSFIKKFQINFPNHLKIDVDGLEAKIIYGALNTLKDNRLKSILIELNDKLPEDMELIKIIESCGLKILHKKHSEMLDNTIYSHGYNYIFVRDKQINI